MGNDESKQGGEQNESEKAAYGRQRERTRQAERDAEEYLEKLRRQEEESREKDREVARQMTELRNMGSLAVSQAQQIQNLENEAQARKKEQEELEIQKKITEEQLEILQAEKQKQQRLDAELKEFKWGFKIEWTEAALSQLQANVMMDIHDSCGKDVQLKILIFGPTGCGKSTVCNGFRSALLKQPLVSHFHAVASQAETMTKGFKGAKYGNHWIIDMGGIYETKSIKDENIRDIVSGRIPFYAGLSKNLELEKKTDAPRPGDNDVACVVIVLRAGMTLGSELKRQIGVILQLGGEGVITFHLVLTCLDICDPKFSDKKQLPTLFDSPSVQGAVKHMSEETGIPPTSISFVRNYVKESDTDLNTNILYLKVLEKIVFAAKEQVEYNLMTKIQKDEYKKKPFWKVRK